MTDQDRRGTLDSTRRGGVFLVGIGCLTLWVATPTPSLASSLAPTHLKGLTAVNVSVHVSREIPGSRALESLLKRRVEDALVRAGLSVVARGEEWFDVNVSGRPIQVGKRRAMFALSIAVHLREHVRLRRDTALDVPGGGALTWWDQCLTLASADELQNTIAKAVLRFVELFTDDVRSVNNQLPASSSMKGYSEPGSRGSG